MNWHYEIIYTKVTTDQTFNRNHSGVALRKAVNSRWAPSREMGIVASSILRLRTSRQGSKNVSFRIWNQRGLEDMG